MRATEREEPRSSCVAAAPTQGHGMRSTTCVDSHVLDTPWSGL